MLEVDPTGQRGRTATESSRNDSEAVAGVVLEAFDRWLRHRYAPSNCHRRGVSFCRTMSCVFCQMAATSMNYTEYDLHTVCGKIK